MDVRHLQVGGRPGGGAPKRHGKLTDGLRMLVFLELVQAQDEGTTVSKSRTRVSEKYSLTMAQVMEIETEGRQKTWAPL